MAKRKDILNATLKALLAGADVSAFLKIPVTFISELAGLPKGKIDALNTLSSEQFDELMLQSELSTDNAALAAVGTEQIKLLISNFTRLSTDQLEALQKLTQEQYNDVLIKLEIIGTNAAIAAGNTEEIKADVKVLLEKMNKIIPTERSSADVCLNNLPYGSIGGLFKGREGEFEKLKNQLSGEGAAAITQPGALYGLGGIGKTRLAVEFAWWALEEELFDSVFFVRCGSPEAEPTDEKVTQKETAIGRLHAAMNVLASPDLLNIEGGAEEKSEIVFGKILAELNSQEKWLMIFDNVDEPAMREIVLTILPRLSRGKVLVTSRQSDWGNAVISMEIEKLSPKSATEYLLDSTEKQRDKGDDDEVLAKVLAEKLDGLPVALEQAAAYINKMRLGFDAYLRTYDKKQKELLEWQKKNPLPGEYPVSVMATWQMTVEQLGEIERAILEMASFLAPDQIPTMLMKNVGFVTLKMKEDAVFSGDNEKDTENIKKEFFSPSDVQIALSNLSEWSMISLKPDFFSVHRLVQETIRLQMHPIKAPIVCTNTQEWIEEKIHENSPPDNPKNWPFWRMIEKHINALIVYGERIGLSEPTTRLINSLALYCSSQERNFEAEVLYRWALYIQEHAEKPNLPHMDILMHNLGFMYKKAGRLNEAEKIFERVLRNAEKLHGRKHHFVAIRSNSLAGVYIKTGRFNEAEKLLKQAIEIDNDIEEKDSLGYYLLNLATVYEKTGRLEETESLIEEAIKAFELSFGRESHNVANCLVHLSDLYRSTGRADQTEALLKEALEIDLRELGIDHPDLLVGLSMLYRLYVETDRYKEAEGPVIYALKLAEKEYGRNSTEVWPHLNALGQVYQYTERYQKAESVMKQVLEIGEKSENVQDILIALNNLAGLYWATDRFVEAIPLAEKAATIAREKIEEDSLDIAFYLEKLASLYHKVGRIEDAIKILQEVLDINEKEYGSESLKVANYLANISGMYMSIQKEAEAEPLLERGIQIQTKTLGEDHKWVINNLIHLTVIYQTNGNFEKSDDTIRLIMNTDKQNFAYKNPLFPAALVRQARWLMENKKDEEAVHLLEKNLIIVKELYGAQSVYYAITCHMLGKAYYEVNKTEESVSALHKALEISVSIDGITHTNTENAIITYYRILRKLQRPLDGLYEIVAPDIVQKIIEEQEDKDNKKGQ